MLSTYFGKVMVLDCTDMSNKHERPATAEELEWLRMEREHEDRDYPPLGEDDREPDQE
jgi:hypothetical protein